MMITQVLLFRDSSVHAFARYKYDCQASAICHYTDGGSHAMRAANIQLREMISISDAL